MTADFRTVARAICEPYDFVPPWLDIARLHTVEWLNRREERSIANFYAHQRRVGGTMHADMMIALPRGFCRICLCTDRRACIPSCSWTDSTHTLCSACVPPDEP